LFCPFLWLKSGIQHPSFLKICCYVQDQVKDAFLIKVCFKIYFTWDHFIKHKIEIADAIIVFISFILDLVFLNDDAVGGLVGKLISLSPDISKYLGLLTLLRLWRVLRVINGFILGAKQAADKRVHEQKKRVEELEKELAALKQGN